MAEKPNDYPRGTWIDRNHPATFVTNKKHFNIMKITKTKPLSGQFTATWEYNGLVWSDTYKYDETDNRLLVHDSETDVWKAVGHEDHEGGVAPWIDRNHPAIFVTN